MRRHYTDRDRTKDRVVRTWHPIKIERVIRYERIDLCGRGTGRGICTID